MLSIYPACFFKKDNGYSVVFPDLNYLSTYGDTLQEAMCAAVDCLAGFLYTCKEDGDKIPAPSSLDSVIPSGIAKELNLTFSETDTLVNMVSVDVASYAKEHFEKSVKKTLTIPAWLNKAALEQGINFSQTLQEALIKKIGMH